MKKSTKLYIILILSIIQIQGIKRLPEVEVHLDASSETVWLSSLQAIAETYGWEQSFEKVFSFHNSTLFNCMEKNHFQIISQSIQQNYPKYSRELQGIQKGFQTYFNQYISFKYLAAWVYFHELSHTNICQKKSKTLLNYLPKQFLPNKVNTILSNQEEQKQFNNRECTGILVKKRDGTVLHGRGLDQQPPEGMRNIALNMTLYKNNQIIGYTTDVYWFNTGFVTAFVPGVISLEENYRYGTVSIDTLLENISKGIQSQVWPFRNVVENQDLQKQGFQNIVNYLKNIPSGAPMYNIIGGLDNGVVLSFSEKQQNEQNPEYYLNDSAVDGWFLVQTNHDLWKEDPSYDERRTKATQMLQQMRQDLAETYIGLFSIMDAYSVHNDHTIYTGLMDPSSGYYQFFGNDGIKQINKNQ